MSYDPGSRRVYPEVVNVNGHLQYMPGDQAWDYADRTGEYIQFPTAEQANWFAQTLINVLIQTDWGIVFYNNIDNNNLCIDNIRAGISCAFRGVYKTSFGYKWTAYEYTDLEYQNGIDELFSIDQSKHSLFGASKVAADVMVQEYGKYFGMNVGIFRGGCLTGPQHAGAELHGFLSYLIKCFIYKKPYTVFGYKGKQVRDNIHSFDLVNLFWHFHQNPKQGEVYNIGGGRNNTISILEAIEKVNQNAIAFAQTYAEDHAH